MHREEIDVTGSVEYLENVMGTAWLKDNLQSVKESHGGRVSFGCGFDADSAGVSAVAYLWYKAREEMAAAAISGGTCSGPYSLAAAVLAADMAVLSTSPGWTAKLEELKAGKHCLHIAGELCIAAGYVRNGCRVDFAAGAGSFVVECGAVKVLVYCAELPPAVGREVAGRLQQKAAGCGDKPYPAVFYLHAGSTAPVAAGTAGRPSAVVPAEALAACPVPVVVFTTGTRYVNGRPVYIKEGWLVGDAPPAIPAEMLYIPGEMLVSSQSH